MIYQALLTASSGSQTYLTPFIGRYRVRVIKIEYNTQAGAATTEIVLQLTSQTLINQTSLSGTGTTRMLFLNTACNSSPYTDFVIGDGVMVNGQIDINVRSSTGALLPGGPGGFRSLLFTFDFEKMGDF
jgi:hypothetical protein